MEIFSIGKQDVEYRKIHLFQEEIESNWYYQQNQNIFMEFLDLLDRFPKAYPTKLNAVGRKRTKNPVLPFKHIKDWILQMTNEFFEQHPLVTLSTRCYWILHGIHSWDDPRVRCHHCNKADYYKTYNIKSIHVGYPRFCSRGCIHASEEVIEKTKQTNLKNFGVENPYQSEEVKLRISFKKLAKYGNPTYTNPEKAQATWQRKVKENPDLKIQRYAKARQTWLENLGVENPMYCKEIVERQQQAYREICQFKFGGKCSFASDEVRQKAQQTLFRNHGVRYPIQDPDISRKVHQKYNYDGITFDSAPELAVFIWLTNHHFNFEYQPKEYLQYEFEGTIHFYQPDFKIGNRLVEIKGDHLVKPSGIWQCPWDHNQDPIYEAKHQCLILNNVAIWYTKKYMKFVEYIAKKYGTKYLQSFKIN